MTESRQLELRLEGGMMMDTIPEYRVVPSTYYKSRFQMGASGPCPGRATDSDDPSHDVQVPQAGPARAGRRDAMIGGPGYQISC